MRSDSIENGAWAERNPQCVSCVPPPNTTAGTNCCRLLPIACYLFGRALIRLLDDQTIARRETRTAATVETRTAANRCTWCGGQTAIKAETTTSGEKTAGGSTERADLLLEWLGV